MFTLVNQINALAAGLNGLRREVSNLNDKVEKLSVSQNENSNENISLQLGKLTETVEDIKKNLNKVQIDVVSKNNDLKKDIDNLKKEAKLLETTITHKVDQSVNKSVKDRTDLISKELKIHLDSKLSELQNNTNEEQDE
jgi:transcription antitermination factor NusA-like protein